MKRRSFLKALLGGAVAAALPGCKFPAGPTESIAVDLAKPDADQTAMAMIRSGEIGRVDDMVFIESTPEGHAPWRNGGYMYSDELEEQLREAIQPMVEFRQLNNKFKKITLSTEGEYFIDFKTNQYKSRPRIVIPSMLKELKG